MNHHKSNCIGFLVLLAFAAWLIPLTLLAQSPNADGAISPAATVRWWQAAIPIGVPILLMLLKMFWPKIPSALIPVLAPLLGALVDYLATSHLGAGTAWGAALGSAGVGLREVVDQMKKTVSPPPNA